MKEPLVLLVEDNPHIMDINTAALTMRGCRVLQAATYRPAGSSCACMTWS